MSVRQVLVVLNVVALFALALFAVLSLRRTRARHAPQNLEKFHNDETLEGPHLERVLGWTLFFAAVVAVALPVYWLREPNRQHESAHYFDHGAVERGATLFANNQMPEYDAAKSLQCANCHGTDLKGGSASVAHTYKNGTGALVAWKAPALNTVLLRFSEQELHDIITYGRPGTPMQPWGVPGGGPKNEQSINDLVAFITSKQLTPAQAKKQSDTALAAWANEPKQQLTDAQKALTDAQKALAKLEADSKSKPADIKAAVATVDADQQALAWAEDWASRRTSVSQGQLLFEVNCARCHTLGWSVFDPTIVNEPPENVIGQPGGGGSIGFNLGNEKQRFHDSATNGTGVTQQENFITTGSDNEMTYGDGGLGSGKMPGFGEMLSADQIAEIVQYEREGIDKTPVTLEGVNYPGAKY